MGGGSNIIMGKGIVIRTETFLEKVSAKYNSNFDDVCEAIDTFDDEIFDNYKIIIDSYINCTYDNVDDCNDSDFNEYNNEIGDIDEDNMEKQYTGIHREGILIMLRSDSFHNSNTFTGSTYVSKEFIDNMTITKKDIQIFAKICKDYKFVKQSPQIYIKSNSFQ